MTAEPIPAWQADAVASRAREILRDLDTFEERDSAEFIEARKDLADELADLLREPTRCHARRTEYATAAAEKLMGWRCQGWRCTEPVESQWGYCSEGCYHS